MSNEQFISTDMDCIKGHIKSKNKELGDLSNSVNSLAKKKGKLKSEINHLITCKNSFFDGLTRIRKLILSKKEGSVLQYFSEHDTGLVLYDASEENNGQDGYAICTPFPVPPVKHESELRADKKGVSMTQWLVEVEKYIKFVHDYFSDFEHTKNINIFEKEVEELSKSWEMIKEEKKSIEKTKEKFKRMEEGDNNKYKSQKQSKKNVVCLRESRAALMDFGNNYNSAQNHNSMSVRHFPNHFSTWAVTEEDRSREYPVSRNTNLIKEISDLKTKYESLKERLETSECSSAREERTDFGGRLNDVKVELTHEMQELNSVRSQAIKLREEVHYLNSSIPALSDQKEELESNIRKLKREKEIIKEDISSYQERSKVLNQRFTTQENWAKDEIKAIVKKIDEKNVQLDKAITREQEIDFKIVHRNEELNNITHKIRLATEKFEAMDHKIKENSWLDMELDNKNKVLGLVDTKISIREEELNEAEGQLHSIKKIAEDYNSKVKQSKIAQKKLQEESRHFEKLAQIKKEELDDLENILTNKLDGKNELSELILLREGQLSKIENELLEKQEWVDKFQDAIEKLLNDMGQFNQNYECQKAEKSNEIIRLKKEINRLSKKQQKINYHMMNGQSHREKNNHSVLTTNKDYRAIRGELKNMQMLIDQAQTKEILESSPDNYNCNTRRDTDEKVWDNDFISQNLQVSEYKNQDCDISETMKNKKQWKAKSSMEKVPNPYICHLRTSSAGGLAMHQRRISEPMSLKYLGQSQQSYR